MAKSLLEEKRADQLNLRRLVLEAVEEVLGDPDFGLELSAAAKKRLRRAAKTRVVSTVPLSEAKVWYT